MLYCKMTTTPKSTSTIARTPTSTRLTGAFIPLPRRVIQMFKRSLPSLYLRSRFFCPTVNSEKGLQLGEGRFALVRHELTTSCHLFCHFTSSRFGRLVCFDPHEGSRLVTLVCSVGNSVLQFRGVSWLP